MSDEQFYGVLRSTIEFLHAQGCGEAAGAVSDTLARLSRPSPLAWDLRDEENGKWRIVQIDVANGLGSIAPNV